MKCDWNSNSYFHWFCLRYFLYALGGLGKKGLGFTSGFILHYLQKYFFPFSFFLFSYNRPAYSLATFIPLFSPHYPSSDAYKMVPPSVTLSVETRMKVRFSKEKEGGCRDREHAVAFFFPFHSRLWPFFDGGCSYFFLSSFYDASRVM